MGLNCTERWTPHLNFVIYKRNWNSSFSVSEAGIIFTRNYFAPTPPPPPVLFLSYVLAYSDTV